jgi:FPC/CPF motif-containing protein YcgG
MADPARVPDWLIREYRSFHETVIDEDFPCNFGLAAEKDHELRYTFVQGDDLAALPQTLEAFLQLSRSHPNVKHNLTVFFEPEPEARAFEYYRTRFWEVLNFLHAHDRAPWPPQIPTDKDDPLWEFCFGGDPIFMFAASPAYVQRRSRNYGNSFVMLFQPKRIFKGIESETPAGTKARRVIRARLKKWDRSEALHPDVNDYGEVLVHRWKQYVLSDDNTPARGGCPFAFRKEPVLEQR